MLASKGLLSYATASDTCPDVHGSDHCPVFADFNLSAIAQELLLSKPILSDNGSYSNITTSQKTLSTSYFQKQSPPKPWPVAVKSDQISVATSPNSSASSVRDVLKRKSDTTSKDPKKAQKTLGSFFQTKSPASNRTTSGSIALDVQGAGYADVALDHDFSPRLDRKRAHSVEKRLEVSNAFASLFVKPEIPLCDGHQQPAKLQKTKKKGANQGREFYMCAVPIGAGQCKFWKWRKT